MKNIIDELISYIKEYERKLGYLPRRINLPVFRKKEVGYYSQIRIATVLPPKKILTEEVEMDLTEFKDHFVFLHYHPKWYIEIS